MSSIVLECMDISKKINDRDIIRNINLTLYEGDILGIIGQNGSGKTTTIKCILGLCKINKGKVVINKYDISLNFKDAISSVGAIVEGPDLYSYMSGYDNLLISSRIYNIDRTRVDEVVKLVGLENSIKLRVSKYSLGMKQRLGIAQAILHYPKLLILDEPTNGLDPEGVSDFRKLVLYLAKKEKMGIIIASHNLLELENICNKICIIKNGMIISNEEFNCNNNKINDYVIEVNDIKIDNILKEYSVIDDNHIKLSTYRKNIPIILNKLISNNIKVYSIYKDRLSLEDIYINKIRENIN